MHRLEYSSLLTPKEKFYLEPIACIHVGNKGFEQEKFDERIQAILEEPNRYTVLMGDLHDAIYPSANEKRYDPDTIDMRFWPPQKGYKWLEKKLKPLADKNKILGISEGNHDRTLFKRFGHNYIKELCDNLEVPYLGYVWFLKLKFPNKQSYIINGAHGHYSGRDFGGNINHLGKLRMGYDADIFLRAHSHQIGFHDKKIETFNGSKMIYFASVGSFLNAFKEGQISYAEEADLLPLPTGTISFSMDPWKNKIDFYK